MSEVNIPFDDAGSLEPLPGFVKRTVVLRAEELSKTYAPISAAEGRGGLELFRGLNHSTEPVSEAQYCVDPMQCSGAAILLTGQT